MIPYYTTQKNTQKPVLDPNPQVTGPIDFFKISSVLSTPSFIEYIKTPSHIKFFEVDEIVFLRFFLWDNDLYKCLNVSSVAAIFKNWKIEGIFRLGVDPMLLQRWSESSRR